MSLQFIFGNSGSGKSHYLYETIIRESKQHPDRNYIIIVPEQFTMQTQKDLVSMHPDGGIMNIDILSFGRLAHRIFEEVGADRRTVLTETGKNLMIRKVAIQEQEHLPLLGSRMNRPGYVSEVKSVLSELMQYEVTDFDLMEMERKSENRPLLQAKLKDLRCLYRAFSEYQKERFLKPEEIYDVLCRAAGHSTLLRRSTLAFDGFAGFTPAQINVLEELLVICPKVYLTVTIDARESAFSAVHEQDLFAPSRKLVKSVREAARHAAGRRTADRQKADVPVHELPDRTAQIRKTDSQEENPEGFLEEPVILGKECRPRFKEGGALDHLEQNLFRARKRTFRGIPDQLSLHVSQTPADEVHFAARSIAKLVREKGLRYREIAVITGDLSSYHNYVKQIFPQYGISAFVDETRTILLNPCLEFVRGALDITRRDFSAETVFRFLRTGMTGLGQEELDRLENYVLAAGIRGRRKWMQEWQYRPGRLTEEELALLNESRVRVMELLGPFAERMAVRRQPLRAYAETLFGLLTECQVQQKLNDREAQLKNLGEPEQAKEYAQIYGILIRLIDEMVDLLGEEEMDQTEFAEILDAGLAEAKVGVIPPGIDQVQVGDIRRTRLAHVRVLFFLGLNDGWVPAHSDGGGIVSDMERELMKENGIELAPSARENGYIQRFYLYQNLTKPRDYLYLSWCVGSSDGKVMRPSYLVSVIRRLFPEILEVEEQSAGSSVYQITSKQNGMPYFLNGLEQARERKPDGAWTELYSRYRQDPDYRDRVETLVGAAFAGAGSGTLTFHTSRELYGEVMTNSVTRLEQFAACAFAHFAQYGLHLQERDLYGVRPADLGILFHRAMELFSRRASVGGKDWVDLTEQEQNELMERCVDDVTAEYGADVLHENARSEYTIHRLKRILCRSAWALHEQLAAGSFRPAGFEISFDDAKDLEAVNVRFGENSRIRLQGRIDRVDTAQDQDHVYVKIIDYKSGMTQFDPVSLYYGLQLQLVVYLNAALELELKQSGGKDVVPAGIFYYHMQDPVLDKESGMDHEQIRQKMLKKLRPDGVLNSDEEVLRMLDRGMSGDSLVIPAGRKKDGSLKAASSVVTTDQFRLLSRYVQRKMSAMGEAMIQGEISAAPAVQNGKSPCEYCRYSDVCGFDRKIPGMCERNLPKLSKEAVWEKIEEELGENEDEEVNGSELDGRTAERH